MIGERPSRLSGWTSEGRTHLLALLGIRRGRDVARICHVRPATISELANGNHRYPGYKLALALQKHFSIPFPSWDEKNGLVASKFTQVNLTAAIVHEDADAERADSRFKGHAASEMSMADPIKPVPPAPDLPKVTRPAGPTNPYNEIAQRVAQGAGAGKRSDTVPNAPVPSFLRTSKGGGSR